MPIGAIAILTIQRTINNGFFAGFVIALGAAIADVLYASIAALGLTFISDFLLSIKFYLAIIGGIFILSMGFKLITSDTIKQYRRPVKKNSHTNSFFTSFFLALSNPITILGFTGFLASFGIITDGMALQLVILLLLSILAGALTWWICICFLVSKFKKKITLRLLVSINRIAGIMLILFGMGLIVFMFIEK